MTRSARPGDFLRIDDRSGFAVYASETRKEWNGAIVDRRSYEARHPQDFARARVDRQRAPDPRPRPTDIFRTTTLINDSFNSSAGWTLQHATILSGTLQFLGGGIEACIAAKVSSVGIHAGAYAYAIDILSTDNSQPITLTIGGISSIISISGPGLYTGAANGGADNQIIQLRQTDDNTVIGSLVVTF